MKILFCILSVIVLFIIVVCLRHFREKTIGESKRITAPEPSGAWPIIGHLHLLKGQVPIARILGTMADKYGPVFSLKLGSRRALIVSNWEMVKECFTTNDLNFANRPSSAFGRFVSHNYASFGVAPYGSYWRDVRKMVNLELLTGHRLEKLKHHRESEYKNWIRELYLLCAKNDASVPTKVVLNEWLELLYFKLILRMLAGKRFSTISEIKNNPEEKRLKEAVKHAMYLSGVFVYSDAIPYIEWLDIGGFIKTMKQAGKELDAIVSGWLEEHIQKGKSPDIEGEADFMDVMLSTIPQNTIISGHKRDVIIKSTTEVLLLAGSETTSETIIWALSLLLNDPKVLKLARNELDLQIGKHRWVEEADIPNLNYLKAIVKETLRLYPGPVAGPREAIEDCHVGKFFVPKGTRLIPNIWKLHRDPRIWSDALEFKPERFLDTFANISFNGQNFEYIPFGSGRRMCPAVNYALKVVQLILARVLQGFDITTPMGMPVDMKEGLGISMPKLKPLEVLLTPRLPLELYQEA